VKRNESGGATDLLPGCLLADGIEPFSGDLSQAVFADRQRIVPARMASIVTSGVAPNGAAFQFQSAPAPQTHARQPQSVIGYIGRNCRPKEAVVI